MNSRKLTWVIMILFFNQLNLYAQKMEDFTKNWKKVADFEKKGLPVSAQNEVLNIFNLAIATGNNTQQDRKSVV